MKGEPNRTVLRLGNHLLGWVYWIVPSEDPYNTNDYTAPIGIYVQNKTKTG